MSDPLAVIAQLPGVSEAVEEAREAIDQLYKHRILRRRSPEVSIESSLRGARASAAIEGADVPLEVLRRDEVSDPVVQGALRASAELGRLGSTWRIAPRQVLARLHTVAAAGLVDEAHLGRPRGTTGSAASGGATGSAASALGSLAVDASALGVPTPGTSALSTPAVDASIALASGTPPLAPGASIPGASVPGASTPGTFTSDASTSATSATPGAAITHVPAGATPSSSAPGGAPTSGATASSSASGGAPMAGATPSSSASGGALTSGSGAPSSPDASVASLSAVEGLVSGSFAISAPTAHPDPLGLGPAPSAEETAARMDGLVMLLATPTKAPALVLAAIVHAELAVLRPFGVADGVVARAAERLTLVEYGLDPKSLAAVEVGHLELDYAAGLRGYLSGTSEGVAAWVRQCAAAVTLGVRETTAICEALQRG